MGDIFQNLIEIYEDKPIRKVEQKGQRFFCLYCTKRRLSEFEKYTLKDWTN